MSVLRVISNLMYYSSVNIICTIDEFRTVRAYVSVEPYY